MARGEEKPPGKTKGTRPLRSVVTIQQLTRQAVTTDRSSGAVLGIRYDSRLLSDKVFVDDLQAALALVVDTKQLDVKGKALYSPTAIEWLEIIVVAASTGIAVGILNKVGEDIWEKLKSAAAKAQKRLVQRKGNFKTANHTSSTEMDFDITLKSQNCIVSGHARVRNYNEASQALKLAWEIANDANERMTNGATTVREDSKFMASKMLRGRAHPSEYWFLFDYSYDPKLKKWSLVRITGHDYGIELYH